MGARSSWGRVWGVVCACGALTGCLSAFGGSPDAAHRLRLEASPRFVDGVFQNDVYTGTEIQLWDTMYRLARGPEVRTPPTPLPLRLLGSSDFGEEAPEGLRATWLGHATVLVELEGVRILTDPIWSERASPFESLGPSRFQPPPVALSALPKLDAVVISHDHYDHLDEATIRALAPTGVRFFVPLGVSAHLLAWGVEAGQITELDWWEEGQVGEVRIVATPARHFSGRSLTNRNSTLWASWAFVGPSRRVYFGGDTGMFDGFAVIGERLGPFELTLMPIGAYDRSWKSVHVTPEEAVVAHQAVEGGLLLPIHWGTFNLAMHGWDEPAERLVSHAVSEGVEVVTPELGQIVDLDAPPAPKCWWRPEAGPATAQR